MNFWILLLSCLVKWQLKDLVTQSNPDPKNIKTKNIFVTNYITKWYWYFLKFVSLHFGTGRGDWIGVTDSPLSMSGIGILIIPEQKTWYSKNWKRNTNIHDCNIFIIVKNINWLKLVYHFRRTRVCWTLNQESSWYLAANPSALSARAPKYDLTHHYSKKMLQQIIISNTANIVM